MISTKGRYALRVMVDLAEHDDEGNIPLKEVAERQGISKKYLEIIMRELVNGKLVSSTIGKGGGYRLRRKPEEYTVGEILELMEGSLATVACLADNAEPCPRASECRTLGLWAGYDRLTREYFHGKHLSDLLSPTRRS
ncbi:MAG: Rrf2 family transcriptional regulator [Actinomycetota bacterium]|nr:Rrf2 family transcriptional regulator [Actinomycetota bacterium]